MHHTPATLQRWQLPRFGLAHLERTEAPMPSPGPNQILVRTEAVALNYRDLLMAQDGMGMPLEFPFTPPRTWPARCWLRARASPAGAPATGC
jgi:hypothetical protein